MLLANTAMRHSEHCWQALTCTEGLSTTSRKALRALESYWNRLESSGGTLESICSNLVSSWVEPLRTHGVHGIAFWIVSFKMAPFLTLNRLPKWLNFRIYHGSILTSKMAPFWPLKLTPKWAPYLLFQLPWQLHFKLIIQVVLEGYLGRMKTA